MNTKKSGSFCSEAGLASIRQDYLRTLRQLYFDELADYLGVLMGKIFYAKFIYSKLLLAFAQKENYDIKKGRLCDMEQRLDFGMKDNLSLMDYVGPIPLSSSRVHNYFINCLEKIGVTFLEDELLSLVEDVEGALSFDRRTVNLFANDINDRASKYGYKSICTPVPMEGARNEPRLYIADENINIRDKELLVLTSNCRLCGNYDGIVRAHKTLYSICYSVLILCHRDEVNRYIIPFVKRSPFVGIIDEVLYADDSVMLILNPREDRYVLSNQKCEITNEFITLHNQSVSRKIEDGYCFSLDIADYHSFCDKPTDDISVTNIPDVLLKEGYLNKVLAAVDEDGHVELRYFQNWNKARAWKRQPVAVIEVPGYIGTDYEKNILAVISGIPSLADSDWKMISFWIRRIIHPKVEMATQEAAYEFVCGWIDKVFGNEPPPLLKERLFRYEKASDMASAIFSISLNENCTAAVVEEIKGWLRSHRRPDGRQLSLKSPVFTLCILASGSMPYEHQISSAMYRQKGGE